MGCTQAELLAWLPGACGQRPIVVDGRCARVVEIGGGRLVLDWHPLPPRRIALVTLPRLQVRFAFEGVDENERQRFMRRFDLFTQRGGG